MKQYAPFLILAVALFAAGAYARHLKWQFLQANRAAAIARQNLTAAQDSLRVVKKERDSLTYAITSRVADRVGTQATLDPEEETVRGTSEPTPTPGRDPAPASPHPDSVRHIITHVGTRYRLSGWVDVYTRDLIRYELTADMRSFTVQTWETTVDDVQETRIQAPRGVRVTALSGTTTPPSVQPPSIGVDLGTFWQPDRQGVFVGYRRQTSLPLIPVDIFASGEVQMGLSDATLQPLVRVGLSF